MKNWQREKLEKLLKKDGKEKAVRALKTVRQNNSERESRGASDFFPPDCTNCNAGSLCVPQSDFQGDECIWNCTIDPAGDWLDVPECSIQIKYFFHAIAEADDKKHDIIWEANVDADSNENWTYACLDGCNPPDGSYDLWNNEDWLESCPANRSVDSGSDCDSTPKLYNYCTNTACGCFACDSDGAQHFVTQNPW